MSISSLILRAVLVGRQPSVELPNPTWCEIHESADKRGIAPSSSQNSDLLVTVFGLSGG
jgi:hypothetical protein